MPCSFREEQILARYASLVYLGEGRYGYASAAGAQQDWLVSKTEQISEVVCDQNEPSPGIKRNDAVTHG